MQASADGATATNTIIDIQDTACADAAFNKGVTALADECIAVYHFRWRRCHHGSEFPITIGDIAHNSALACRHSLAHLILCWVLDATELLGGPYDHDIFTPPCGVIDSKAHHDFGTSAEQRPRHGHRQRLELVKHIAIYGVCLTPCRIPPGFAPCPRCLGRRKIASAQCQARIVVVPIWRAATCWRRLARWCRRYCRPKQRRDARKGDCICNVHGRHNYHQQHKSSSQARCSAQHSSLVLPA
mmetsp:Transcript_64312/g.104047  ORF Transcript_64312/g.104047 Transcript_64312/m.104047 type:complete len:242 (+) Transcript_64312:295-1020(+)